MTLIRNESGYITIESAILWPGLLLIVCLFIGFFCIAFKVGAFQALVNHERLIAELKTDRSYKIEQIENAQTHLNKQYNQQSHVDDLTRTKQAYQVEMTAPFYKDSVILEAHTDRWRLPFLYQLGFAKRLGGGMDQLRQKLGGQP